MIQNLLIDKYGKYIGRLDIDEQPDSLILSTLIINGKSRNKGVGSKIMIDIINYADKHNKIIALTPSPELGSDKKRLITFYKQFGFTPNNNSVDSYVYKESMIRYPKMNESAKPVIKQLLREALLGKDEASLTSIADFTNFAKDFLGINDDIKIELAFERTEELKTTALYDTRGRIAVYVKNRAIVDVCRSIAHELVHHKQKLEDRFKNVVKDGEDGSPIENEANAVAGVIIRKWGKSHPEIYI